MIIRHVLIYAGMSLFPALASVTTLMVFTRFMTPSEFGEYSLTVNIVSTAVAVFAGFLIIGLGRFEPAVEGNEERIKLHSTIMITAVLLGLIGAFFIIVLFFLDLLPPLSVNYYFIVVLFFITFYLLLGQRLINANLQPIKYGVSQALKNILLLVFGSVAFFLGYGVNGVLGSLVFASLIAALPALSLWKKIALKSYDLNILKQIWSYGAPLTFLYLFVMIISFSDRIFIDIMLDSSSVGLYSASYDFTQYTLGLIATTLHLAAFPIILKAYEEEGSHKTTVLLYTNVRILLFLMIPVTLGFISVKNEVAKIFFGEPFLVSSVMLIPILAFTVLLSSVKSYYFDYAFQLTKNTWLQALAPLIAATVNVFLNYIFILKMGIVGAAYATLISYVVYLAFTIFLSLKVFSLPRFPLLLALKVSMASCVMWLIVSSIELKVNVISMLVVKVLIGIFVFSLCVLLFIRKDFISLLKDAENLRGLR